MLLFTLLLFMFCSLQMALAMLQGIVQSLKDAFGFVDCVEREGRIFFHFSELVDPDWAIRVQDEVEFTVVPVGIDQVLHLCLNL